MLSIEQRQSFERDGYLVVRELFSADEVRDLRGHYMRLREAGSYPGDMVAETRLKSDDPLVRYPRMIHMHHWDELSRRWLLDPRLNECLTTLLGLEPLAVQTMLYFKPPGARGQALHQDNFYLQVAPGTCAAAWLTLDDSDEENGCMQVVPGTGELPILCPEKADSGVSFTSVRTPLHSGMKSVPVVMRAGDVLFFTGSLIHGSFPNSSRDRFRRTLIGHYITGDAAKVTAGCRPVLRMDGTEISLEASEGGAPCGVWTDRDGQPQIEMRSLAAHGANGVSP